VSVNKVSKQWDVFVNDVQMECVWEEEVCKYYLLMYMYTHTFLVCRGAMPLLPAAVQTFSGCTIVNGDLTFNVVTYEQFM